MALELAGFFCPFVVLCHRSFRIYLGLDEKSEAQASLALTGLPSQLVGTVLVVELQETQQRTTLVTFSQIKNVYS